MSCNSYGLIGCIGVYRGKSHLYSGKQEPNLPYEGAQEIYLSKGELPSLSAHYLPMEQIPMHYIPSYSNNSQENNTLNYVQQPILSARELGFSYAPKLDLLLTYMAESKKSEQSQKYSSKCFQNQSPNLQTQSTQKEMNLHKERDELEQLIAKEKMVMLNAN